MEITQLGVIALLKSGITGERAQLPEQFDMEQAYAVLRSHSTLALGYVGAMNCGVPKQLPIMQKLRMHYAAALINSEAQMADVDRICNAFENSRIDHMLLKGCNMKALYPNPELRGMSDADILIRVEQYDRIRPVMQQLGFRELPESDHELNWQSKALHVELHKRLMPIINQDYYRYYGDGWKLAKIQQGFRYAMTEEDQFIYLFTHFAKHYRNGGIGCRHVVDLWVYLRHYTNMDMAYIRKELEKLALSVFFENFLRMQAAWFEDGQWDAVTEFMTQVIFASGDWGSAKSHGMSELLRRKKGKDSAGAGKLRWLVWRAFPPRSMMYGRYPVLKKWPVLLPFVWVKRWIDTLLFRRDRLKRSYQILTQTSVAEIESYEQSLAYVGLEFET